MFAGKFVIPFVFWFNTTLFFPYKYTAKLSYVFSLFSLLENITIFVIIMRILISPLDWGLGHASRSAAVVKHLLAHHNEVLLAGSGDSLQLLQSEFPHLPTVNLSSFSPWVPSWLPLPLAITLQLPYFFFCILREHMALRRVVREHNIDMVISDNRYGLYSSSCPTAIITHQLSPIPWTSCPALIRHVVSWGIARLLSKFNFCIVPDFPDHRLAGSLSTASCRVKSRLFYVGPLSRYAEYKVKNAPLDIYSLHIITGPRKTRREYESSLNAPLTQPLTTHDAPSVLIGGIDNNNPNYNCYPNASAPEIAHFIQRAQHVYSHSGYTTIMDLYILNALDRAVLTPTKGQAEQVYLASLLAEKTMPDAQ